MTAKEHINQIQEGWTSANSRNVATTAKAIEDIISSIFGDAAYIGYELLQNADDAGYSSEEGVDVKYYLLDKHLIIQHNGSHFNFDNVEALCDYGSSSKAKEGSDKIGYKGIGFKSVFNIADKVWILSKDYTFRFDKAHWEKQNIPMPWQIVPIYTEGSETPREISTFLNSEKVTFILELKEGVEKNRIKKEIGESLKNEQNLLFLRHVNKFELLYQDPKSGLIVSFRRILKEKADHVISLKKHKKGVLKETTSWHISTFQITIPDEISKTLTTNIPEKLKTAKSIDLSFAAKLKDDNTVELLGRPFIFSYLPTEKRYEFPFVVNSNFLLNPERTELLSVAWNEFLFEQIGYFQFKWFQEMAQDERFKFEFAGLLVKYAVNATGFNGKLNAGVIKAQTEIAFVPVLNSNELN